MKPLRSTLFCLSTLVLATATAHADSWPTRSVRLVVPYTAGSQFDIVARMVATKMGDHLGQSVVIENKPGAGSMVGAEYVSRAANDGYTLLYAGTNMFAIAPHVYSKMPYKVSDFQTISLVSELPLGLMVSAEIPAKTLPEFIDYVKANPGKINFGSPAEGGTQHLLCELVKHKTGVDMTHIPYKGTVQVIQDLLPNRVSAACDGVYSYLPNAKEGKLRLLGISSAKRVESLPDVPTFQELGIPEATISAWGGIVAPAGTPDAVIKKLHAAVVAAVNAPDVQERITTNAALPRSSTSEEFDAVIKKDSATWKEVVDRLGIRKD